MFTHYTALPRSLCVVPCCFLTFVLASLSPDPLDFSKMNYNYLKDRWPNRIIPTPNSPEPSFQEPIPNMTVVAGRDVTLPCAVENLGLFRVAWIHTDRHTLISLHDRLIFKSSKYAVTHNMKTWWLHIIDVSEGDSGEYMCQINTSPMKSQVGYLDVIVPPRIDENRTSSDTEARENSDVYLKCAASGSPTPDVKWRKEGDKEIVMGTKKVPVVYGEWLNITKASRIHMGAYLCIASNGAPVSISKRILLYIQFPPMIWIPHQLVGSAIGTDAYLDCNLESHPKSISYWTREGGIMILSSAKYNIILIEMGNYKSQMRLKIFNITPDDYGLYSCVAKNPLGETEGAIRLYEITRSTSSLSSSTTTTKVSSSSSHNNEGSGNAEVRNIEASKKQIPEFYNMEGQVSQHPIERGTSIAEGGIFDKGGVSNFGDRKDRTISSILLVLIFTIWKHFPN